MAGEHTYEFVFDLGSPYSYLASTQLDRLRERTGAEAVLTPVALGFIFKATGAPQVPSPARLVFIRADVRRWAGRYAAPLEFPDSWPARTLLGQRAILAAEGPRARKAAMHALYHAYYGEGRDISDAAVVRAALDEAGLEGQTLLARAETAELKEALRKNTEEAVRRGVFGVPTFLVGGELFWGNDRIDFVEEALKRGR